MVFLFDIFFVLFSIESSKKFAESYSADVDIADDADAAAAAAKSKKKRTRELDLDAEDNIRLDDDDDDGDDGNKAGDKRRVSKRDYNDDALDVDNEVYARAKALARVKEQKVQKKVVVVVVFFFQLNFIFKSFD